MGMFDRVWVNCPVCGEREDFQSKRGECSLHDYTQYKVPVEIALDLDGEVLACTGCGTKLQLYIPDTRVPETIEMRLTIFGDNNEIS